MSQLHARLFEKWVHTSGDLTYDEWISKRREEGKRALDMKLAAAQQALGNQFIRNQQHQMQQGMLGGAMGIFGGGQFNRWMKYRGW